MAEDKGVFDGFDFLANMIVRDDNNPGKPRRDDNDNIVDIEPDELQKKLAEPNDVDDNKGKTNVIPDDDNDDQGDADDHKGSNDDDSKAGDYDKNDEFEKDISSYFVTEFAKKAGIDLDEDHNIETIDDVITLLNNVIEDNSKPTYSSDEVAKFDEFVQQGGNLKDFYDQVYAGRVQVDKLDIGKEDDQKAVIRQHLANQGYSDMKIKRAIDRYEESGVLAEEAEDALELVKEFDKKNAQRLLKEQEQFFQEQEKMKQEFLRDVNTTMKSVSELAGVTISDRDKKELFNYMFATDKSGMTGFQRDVQKDVMSLMEVAFFTKNKDKVINKTKKKATSDAYKTLQEKIKSQRGKLGKSGSQIDDDNSDMGSLGNFGKGIIF